MVTAAAVATVAAASGNSGTRAGRQRRMGCSISQYDTPATASVAPHRAANKRQSGPPGAFAVERQKDWPVPQVDAVGDGAQPHQRAPGQDAGDRAALLQRHRGDHEDGRDRDRRAADRGGIRRRCRWRSASPPPVQPARASGSNRATRRPHRDRIRHQPRFSDGQSRTSRADAAEPISNACARVSVPK